MENVMNRNHIMPRARSEQLVVQDLTTETLVYDLERHKVHCLNPSAAYVWRRCDGTATFGDVAEGLGAEFGLPADTRIVALALESLRAARLVDGLAKADLAVPRLGRRQALKWVGVAAGVA